MKIKKKTLEADADPESDLWVAAQLSGIRAKLHKQNLTNENMLSKTDFEIYIGQGTRSGTASKQHSMRDCRKDLPSELYNGASSNTRENCEVLSSGAIVNWTSVADAGANDKTASHSRPP